MALLTSAEVISMLGFDDDHRENVERFIGSAMGEFLDFLNQKGYSRTQFSDDFVNQNIILPCVKNLYTSILNTDDDVLSDFVLPSLLNASGSVEKIYGHISTNSLLTVRDTSETKILLEIVDDLTILFGDTGSYQLPNPPAGSKYTNVVADMLFKFGALSATEASALGNDCHSYARYVDHDDKQISWCRSLGFRGQWYTVANDENSGGTFTIGLATLRVGNFDYIWTVDFNPTNNQMSFLRSGLAPTAQRNPFLVSAIITAECIAV